MQSCLVAIISANVQDIYSRLTLGSGITRLSAVSLRQTKLVISEKSRNLPSLRQSSPGSTSPCSLSFQPQSKAASPTRGARPMRRKIKEKLPVRSLTNPANG
jgi:hypothetical protein